jgi:hypothetical protein
MTSLKSPTIWTVVLNFFILVGAGYGLACLGLIEVAGLFHRFEIGNENFSLSLSTNYDKSLGPAALFCLIGKIVLLLSFALKKNGAIFWTRIVGLVFLWVGFYYLTHNFFDVTDNTGSQLGFFTGVPFLIISIRLAYKTIKQDAVKASVDNE